LLRSCPTPREIPDSPAADSWPQLLGPRAMKFCELDGSHDASRALSSHFHARSGGPRARHCSVERMRREFGSSPLRSPGRASGALRLEILVNGCACRFDEAKKRNGCPADL
jgi:hypothetical protein